MAEFCVANDWYKVSQKNSLHEKCSHWEFSGQHFPTFGLNTERRFASLRVQSECGVISTGVISTKI